MTADKLAELFPDPAVRKVVARVSKNNRSDAEEMENDYELLDKDLKRVSWQSGAACFGGLADMYAAKETCRYLRYSPDCSDELYWESCLRWVELCQELGIISSKQTPTDILSAGLQLDLHDPELYVGNLYIQLCLLRWLREAPVLVENVLDLVDNAGRDFWASVAYCHGYNVPNVDHSLLPYSGGIYSVVGWDKTAFRDFALVLRMHEATACPKTVDDRQAGEALNKGEDFAWNWQGASVRPPKKFVLKEREMLLSGELFPLLGSRSYEEAETLVKQFNQRKSVVQFEDSNS